MVEVSGVVAAPADVVVDRVFEYFDSRRGAHYPAVEIDPPARTVAIQGGWWYRGEYTVDDHPGGSRVTHRVYNVATWMRWGVPLANRLFIGFRPKVEAGFAEFLKQLR
jgi:hypothetical protein